MDLNTLEPGDRVAVPSDWASTVYIDRGIYGADPLQFRIETVPAEPTVPSLLVLSGHSIYLVDSRDWNEGEVGEEAVALISKRRVLPLH